jgi:hypothetical protein
VDVNSGQQWAMYAWAAAVAIAVLAGIWFATNRGATRRSLPLEHVAAATLLALFGWEMLVALPASTMGLWALTAGLGEARGVEGQQAFVLGQAVFAVATAVAVIGILRRRTWGIALGVGLAAALVVWTVVNTLWLFVTLGTSMSSDMYLGITTSALGRGVPALVAIGLLAWPLVRRPTPRPTDRAAERDWPAAPAPDARP